MLEQQSHTKLQCQVIWSAVLDGRWVVEVTRLGPATGRLTVRGADAEESALSEEVPLMYGADFGPDVSDVAAWQDRAANFVDARQQAEASHA